jgi:hypothetical protein
MPAIVLGLPFCGCFSGSPVYGCSTIGLAHSRNLLMALSRPQSSNPPELRALVTAYRYQKQPVPGSSQNQILKSLDY